MASLSEILARAASLARERNLKYEGAVTPAEAYELLQRAPGAKLVDVRTHAELDYVGRIPGSVEIEWQSYPGGQPNPHFLAQLKQQVDGEARRRPAVQPCHQVLALGPQVGSADVSEVGDFPAAAVLKDDIGKLLGAQKGDEIGGIDQPQLGGHVPQAVGQSFLALQCVGIALPEHAAF